MPVDPDCNQAYQKAKRAAEAATAALNLSDPPLLNELKELGGKIPRADEAEDTPSEKAAAKLMRQEFINKMNRVEKLATGGKSLQDLVQAARAAAVKAQATANDVQEAANAHAVLAGGGGDAAEGGGGPPADGGGYAPADAKGGGGKGGGGKGGGGE